MLLPLLALPLPMGLLLRAGGGGGGLMVVALGMAMFFGLACLRGLMPYTNTAFFSNSALRNVAKTVHINCNGGDEESFECADDAYILDVAEEEGIELPYSCRFCSSCAGRVSEGKSVRPGFPGRQPDGQWLLPRLTA